MLGARSWRKIAAGMLVATGTGAGFASGQTVGTPPAPPVVMPAAPPISLEAVAPGVPAGVPGMAGVPAGVPGMAGVPAGVPGAPSCSCGDRHGLSRWRWHRTHCKRLLQEHFLGYSEEFNEWPLGYAVYAHARTQLNNAQAGHLVFYDYDFVDGTSQLNLRGQDKLAKLGMYLPTTFSPIVVERTPKEAGLDESRRLALVSVLGRGPFPVPGERIVIGPSFDTNRLTGLEPLAIYGNELSGIRSGGAIGGGVTGIGSFVGGGAGFDAGGLSGSAVSGGR
jgi:hypothetical protein